MSKSYSTFIVFHIRIMIVIQLKMWINQQGLKWSCSHIHKKHGLWQGRCSNREKNFRKKHLGEKSDTASKLGAPTLAVGKAEVSGGTLVAVAAWEARQTAARSVSILVTHSALSTCRVAVTWPAVRVGIVTPRTPAGTIATLSNIT